MKKSQAMRKILRKLREWEGSQLEIRTVKEIMEVIENEIGMMPPLLPENQRSLFGLPSYKWEEETKRKRK